MARAGENQCCPVCRSVPGFEILVVIGLYILMFLSGSFEKNKELEN